MKQPPNAACAGRVISRRRRRGRGWHRSRRPALWQIVGMKVEKGLHLGTRRSRALSEGVRKGREEGGGAEGKRGGTSWRKRLARPRDASRSQTRVVLLHCSLPGREQCSSTVDKNVKAHLSALVPVGVQGRACHLHVRDWIPAASSGCPVTLLSPAHAAPWFQRPRHTMAGHGGWVHTRASRS